MNLPARSHPAGQIVCSPDGKFFVTSSHDHTIRVWDFQHFSIIYSMTCSDSAIGMTIDPNEAKIYDIRGPLCCAWQPNALLRLWETDDKESETQSNAASSTQLSSLTETSYNTLPPITTLNFNENTLSYVVGNQDGALSHFSSEGVDLGILAKVFMTITHICYSPNGQFVACSDLARQATAIALDPVDATPSHLPILVSKDSEPITQLLLSHRAEHLPVAAGRFVSVWSIPEKSRISVRPQNTFYRWINSPLRHSGIIGFASESLCVTSWTNTDEQRIVKIDRSSLAPDPLDRRTAWHSRKPSKPYPFSPSETTEHVEKILLTDDGVLALLTVAISNPQKRGKEFLLLHLHDLDNTETITPRPLPLDLLNCLNILPGFLIADVMSLAGQRQRSSATNATLTRVTSPPNKDDRILAFLDDEFWVSTYPLNEIPGARVKRHYFLPRDWLNMDCLELAVMGSDGTLLCPKNGELRGWCMG